MIKNKNIVYNDTEILVPAKLNFGELILQKMWSFKDNVCMINGATEEKITYGEITQQAMNIAVSLTHLGIRKGDTIALFSENRTEFFSAAIGAICAGAVLTAVNVGYTKGELMHVLSISKPKYIFCSPFTHKHHANTLKSLEYIKKIFLFGAKTCAETSGTISFDSLAFPTGDNNASSEIFDVKNKVLLRDVLFEEFEVPEVKGQVDTLAVLYSSGTTGLPKGVMLTHLNVITACCLPGSHDPSYLSLTITPWFHVMGLIGNFTAMVTGRTAVYLPKFEIELYLKTIQSYKVVQLTVVPPVLVALCKSQLAYDVSSVRLIYSGAAPLHKDTLLDVKNKFPNAAVLQGYGMTEATLAVARDTFYLAHLAKPGGVGQVIAGNVVKIADLETRVPLGPNQRGELCVKGLIIMKGYVGKDSSEDFDDEGFFKTGDIGYYDEDGCFFIVDRLKELIKYKAYQVPPAEIEAVLLQHAGIKDAGVVGRAERGAGEVPVAFVVPQPGGTLTEGEVKAFVAERLSNPKHLRGGVRFVDEIPKNPSGKILRKVLKTMVKDNKSKL